MIDYEEIKKKYPLYLSPIPKTDGIILESNIRDIEGMRVLKGDFSLPKEVSVLKYDLEFLGKEGLWLCDTVRVVLMKSKILLVNEDLLNFYVEEPDIIENVVFNILSDIANSPSAVDLFYMFKDSAFKDLDSIGIDYQKLYKDLDNADQWITWTSNSLKSSTDSSITTSASTLDSSYIKLPKYFYYSNNGICSS